MFFSRIRVTVSLRRSFCSSRIQLQDDKNGRNTLETLKNLSEGATRLLSENLQRERESKLKQKDSVAAIFKAEKELPPLDSLLQDELNNFKKRKTDERPIRQMLPNKRYQYNQKTKTVKDLLAVPEFSLSPYLSESKTTELGDFAKFNLRLMNFPISLILASSTSSTGLQFKSFINSLENLNYDAKGGSLAGKYQDPNSMDLLVDYNITSRLDLIKDYLKSSDSKIDESILNSMPHDKDFFIVHLTELHIISTIGFFELFKDHFKSHFNVYFGILNNSHFPTLRKVRKPDNGLSADENKFLESTLVNLASLGLTKVFKKSNGDLLLGKKQV